MCERCKELRYENSKLRDENLTLNRRNQVLLLEIDSLRGQQNEMKYYTLEQAADVLQVSVSMMRKAIGENQVRAFRSGKGGAVRIAHNDLMAYVLKNTNDVLEVCEC